MVVSATLCLAVILAAPRLPRLAGRPGDIASVQAAHRKLTPRLGGLGIFGALLTGAAFAPIGLSASYATFLMAATPLFLAGLAEDLGWHVSPKGRLLAAVVASIAVVVLLEAWVPRIGWSVLDPLMLNGLLGVPVTIFVVVGIANAFNLIDGVNGLAGITALFSTIALSMIAAEAGYDNMVALTTFLALGILGFLALNFPFGLVFLGDAGAYTLGFVLAWFGVAILMTQPDVTPWAILLTMFWPVADTILAIYRRGLGRRPAMQPDRLHAHQLVMRSLEIYWLGRGRRHITNPLTTLILAPFIAVPVFVGVVFWDQNIAAFFAFWGFLAGYFGLYFIALHVARNSGYRFTRKSPEQVTPTNRSL